MSKIEFNISVISEGYEWLIDYSEDDGFIYVVSICADDIDFENKEVGYIHIENIDYLYHVYGQDSEEEIYRCYDLFKVIQREVIEEILI